MFPAIPLCITERHAEFHIKAWKTNMIDDKLSRKILEGTAMPSWNEPGGGLSRTTDVLLGQNVSKRRYKTETSRIPSNSVNKRLVFQCNSTNIRHTESLRLWVPGA